MSNCTDKCFVDKSKDEVNPLFHDIYDYKNRICNNKYDYDDPLTVWKLKTCNSETKCNKVLDIDYNNQNKNAISEDNSACRKRCVCIDAWDELRHIFEITDQEINDTNLVNYTYPDDAFNNMTIDLHNDKYGDDLEDFKLDGEYLIKDLESVKYDGPLKIPDTSTGENKTLVTAEPKEPPNQVKPLSMATVESEEKITAAVQINDFKTKDVVDTKTINTIKAIEFNENDKPTVKKSKNVNKKQSVTKDAAKKRTKCCSAIGSTVDNKREEKENNIEYVYTFGDKYRGGINCGHKNCTECWVQIPPNKGWITEEFITAERQKLIEKKRLHALMGQHEKGAKKMKSGSANEKLAVQKRKEKPTTRVTIADHSTVSTGDGNMKKVLTKTETGRDGPAEPMSVLELTNKNGLYTITVNAFRPDGRLDPTRDPAVFRLGARPDRSEIFSSTSDIHVGMVPPCALDALSPLKTYQDAYTEYIRDDFAVMDKRRVEKKTA